MYRKGSGLIITFGINFIHFTGSLTELVKYKCNNKTTFIQTAPNLGICEGPWTDVHFNHFYQLLCMNTTRLDQRQA